MARKVFISVLGTNDYIEAVYEINGKRANPARFIQEALINELYNDWKESDQVIIFCTNKSEQKNWLDGGHENNGDNKSIGLCSILSNLKENGLKANVEHQIIDEGFTETEIWSVFDKIYSDSPQTHLIFLVY